MRFRIEIYGYVDNTAPLNGLLRDIVTKFEDYHADKSDSDYIDLDLDLNIVQNMKNRLDKDETISKYIKINEQLFNLIVTNYGFCLRFSLEDNFGKVILGELIPELEEV